MRQLATIQQIADVQPIPGADAIEKVRVNDWWCVAKKGEFNTGDICVYHEVDSLVPMHGPYEFLSKGSSPKTIFVDGVGYTGYRLKSIRLRGQLSQGLALPLSALPAVAEAFNGQEIEIGRDVSPLLGIVKYEVPIPASLAGVMKGAFPSFIPKTDEERIQNMGDVVINHINEPFYITEKLDGSSTTYYKKDGDFGVCSRNWELQDTEDNTLWEVARSLKLPECMPDNFAIQGEMVGPGIQGNPLKLNGPTFFAYNVFDIENGEYLNIDDMLDWFARYKVFVSIVPILGKNKILPNSIEDIIAMADGPSVLNTFAKREGLVIRPMQEQKETIRGQAGQRFSFKVISNDYLLTQEQ